MHMNPWQPQAEPAKGGECGVGMEISGLLRPGLWPSPSREGGGFSGMPHSGPHSGLKGFQVTVGS